MIDRGNAVALSLAEPFPEEVDAGAVCALAVIVTATSGQHVSAAPFRVETPSGVMCAGYLPAALPDDPFRHVEEVTLTAPDVVGGVSWTFVVTTHDIGGVPQPEASLTVAFRTRPHATSLAVWDTPSAVIVGTAFDVTVGAKCHAGCVLAGTEIEICDSSGATAGRARLGGEPWPGTAALCWTRLALTAPDDEGCYVWSSRFPQSAATPPHESAACTFSFVTVRPPEHTVSVRVLDCNTQTPLADAYVRLGVHRASTDDTGVATINTSAGEHRLFAGRTGYHDRDATTVSVGGNVTIDIGLTPIPPETPFAYWKG